MIFFINVNLTLKIFREINKSRSYNIIPSMNQCMNHVGLIIEKNKNIQNFNLDKIDFNIFSVWSLKILSNNKLYILYLSF